MPPDDVSPQADRPANPPPRPEVRPQPIVGYIDRIDGRRVTGWAWDRSHPDEALEVEIRVDGRVAATLKADRLRKDLAQGNIGNGAHAFEVELDQPIATDAHARVTAYARSSGAATPVALVNRTVVPDPAPDAAVPPPQLRRWLEDLAIVQRSFEETLKTAARDIRDALRTPGPAADNKPLEELRASQEVLARQIEALEVFHARFDKVLRVAERPATASEVAEPNDRGLKLAVAVAGGMSAVALLIGLWAVLH